MSINVIPFHAKPVRLVDGPLVDVRRTELVEQMKKVILQTETAGDHDDAWLMLRFAGFKHLDIVLLIDDARQAAQQHLVAKIMGAK